MLVITDRQPMFLQSVVGVMGGTLSFKQLDNGSMVIGGGKRGVADAARNLTQIIPAGLSSFVMTAGRVFPHLRDVAYFASMGWNRGLYKR
jgi:sarcosine oxidase subunit beta